MYSRLIKAVTNLGCPKVLLVGDFILDSYVYGDAIRISPEAPVPILKVVSRDNRCGGAGSVAADLAALGAKALCIGFIGNDNSGRLLGNLLTTAGADISGIITNPDRPTITKQRMIGLAQHRHPQQLLRIDEECTEPFSADAYDRILCLYKERLPHCDIVCLQDYNKGLLDEKLCGQFISLARKQNKKVLVDPPLAGDYSKYTGACLITPNRQETAAAAGFAVKTTDDAARAAEILQKKLRLDAVVITLDREGAYLKTADISEHIPTVPRSVYDVTGAGDMVLAMLAAAMASGCDYRAAVQLANIAGGLEVEKFGVATVSIVEILKELSLQNRTQSGKMLDTETLLAELQLHRQQKQTIVFTNGCFDVLHRGHIEYLKFCRAQGNIVVLGLNSDSSVKHLKGPDRPINNQFDRAAVLAGLESVDYIIIFDEPDPLTLIEKIRPDVLVKGADWAEKGIVGRQLVESYGGKVTLAPIVEGKSSSDTIKKMRKLGLNKC